MAKLTELDRARGRLSETKTLEATAKREHTRAQAALDIARQKDVHPRAQLVKARDAASAKLAKRRSQVAAADKALKALEAAAHPKPTLTSRGKALDWLSDHRGLTEDPAGSNDDRRADGIHAAQVRLANGATFLVGEAWCGTWCGNALLHAGVEGVTARLASVALVEEDARAHRRPFRGWTTDPRKVLRGDLVVLFGYGVHIETVREVDLARGIIVTDGGNTSSGNAGSQSNGGGSYRRERSLKDVHGFPLVDYPG